MSEDLPKIVTTPTRPKQQQRQQQRGERVVGAPNAMTPEKIEQQQDVVDPTYQPFCMSPSRTTKHATPPSLVDKEGDCDTATNSQSIFVAKTPEVRTESPENQVERQLQRRRQGLQGRGLTPPGIHNRPNAYNNSNRSQFYDLTPVMRNTSMDIFMNNGEGAADSEAQLVSPEDCEEVQGRLSLPSDLDDPQDAPVIPPLKVLQGKARASSCGMPLSGTRPDNNSSFVDCTTSSLNARTEEPFMADLYSPVEFPPPGKFHTFTSREQYDQMTSKQDAPAVQSSTMGLKPYQPCRQDLLDHGIGALPQEELKSIFNPRRPRNAAPNKNNTNASVKKSDSNLMISTSSISDNSANINSLIPPAIPLDERQWSIPSIRIAHRLDSGWGSVTDEEDSILRMDDDASLSSCSYFTSDDISALVESTNAIYLQPPGTGANTATNDSGFFQIPSHHTSQSEDNDAEDRMFLDDENIMAANTNMEDNTRLRRRKKKEQRAYDWLRTVEAGHDVVAEAASSKFLTGNHPSFIENANSMPNSNNTTNLEIVAPLCRQSSTPTYPTTTKLHHDSAPFPYYQESTSN